MTPPGVERNRPRSIPRIEPGAAPEVFPKNKFTCDGVQLVPEELRHEKKNPTFLHLVFPSRLPMALWTLQNVTCVVLWRVKIKASVLRLNFFLLFLLLSPHIIHK